MTEEMIDHLGHMNVRFYAVNAQAGTAALLARTRYAVVEVYTRHHREQLLGAPLEVRSGFLGIDADGRGARIHHELVNTADGTLAATFVHRVVVLDGVLPAGAEVVDAPAYAAPRTIDLGVDRLASPPALDVLRERGLATRRERRVGAEEVDEQGRYRAELAPMLTWGGEAVDERDDDEHLRLRTDDGHRLGWASMETRLQVAAFPAAGARIQSFGAVLAVHEKVTHHLFWSFDLDRESLLTAFEVVNLAFDIDDRRPVPIPARYRAHEESRLHPDLAAALAPDR